MSTVFISLGFSRQEHWSGLPFPSPICEREVTQSCLTLSNLMDCNLPGSSIHGVFQARVLEWGAIAFSDYRHSWIIAIHGFLEAHCFMNRVDLWLVWVIFILVLCACMCVCKVAVSLASSLSV